MIKGIDVSAYQPAAYDTTGLDFVFTKVTEGLTYTNPRWVAQRDRAKAAGLVWGAYHYPHMANDAKAEADFFLQQVAWKPGDVIVLDWEGYDDANKNVSNARQLAYRDAWLEYVKGKMPDHKVGMYCNKAYWTGIDKTSTCGDFLWIATGGLPAGEPGIEFAWTFHQYSTANEIDHDVAVFATRADMAAWAAGQEPDVALTQADGDLVVDRLLAADKFDAPADAADYSADETNPGHYWSGRTVFRDMVTRVRNLTKAVAALDTKVSALSSPTLDDTQIAALAAALAADAGLADKLAEALAEKLADRLAS
ncbi:glycoside hydrolase family 25 protein [Streptomyces sp. NPDC004237]|uniref:glycoside hydrolase family 25 protein n=1 Tax=Streptomyces sp. NPDC004237 TaxID=3154455 RepID=UPI0033AE99E3